MDAFGFSILIGLALGNFSAPFSYHSKIAPSVHLSARLRAMLLEGDKEASALMLKQDQDQGVRTEEGYSDLK